MPTSTVTWESPLCPFQIEFAADKLEEIRLAVTDAFYALPRGGIETGGVLFGHRMGGRIIIQDYRIAECEHLTGPSFQLSERDLEGMARLLTQAKSEGLEALGWFHSHTRSEIFLSPQDLEIHERFFPQPWQVALVLRPANLQPLRAGYFFRGANGEIEAAESAQEFVIEPLPESAPDVVRVDQPLNGNVPLGHARRLPEPEPEPELDPEPDYADETAYSTIPAKRGYGVWIAALVALLSIAAAAYVTRGQWMPRPADLIKLEASEAEGKLLLRWDGNAPPIREANSGTLHISDGGHISDIPLDPVRLSRGFYLYARQSEKAFARLTIFRSGKPPIEDATSFSGPVIPPVPTEAELAAQHRAEEAQKSQEKMKTDLANQASRNKQLQRAVKDLRDQIQQQQKP